MCVLEEGGGKREDMGGTGKVWVVGGRLCMGLTDNACKGGLKNVGVRDEQHKVMMGGSLRWVAGIVRGEEARNNRAKVKEGKCKWSNVCMSVCLCWYNLLNISPMPRTGRR